ncbi:MAG: tRNA (N(6)-L-threonylcarbamoyladenosine(37)-C(2))-methylthiotransferase MtaB [Chloroflexota bacterium]|nr:tRNA (N(6)-L-threonylcarbamoyladenosine(37)-C(2))-methylthiotransferase MtaB [Chloroflexota bacterium]MDE2961781.1 tRNA (N(6)-L-threonylcarbamoyladenosine(37)-C(2))-methylthiotransferase MtaB [Chloroflexota bacterium]
MATDGTLHVTPVSAKDRSGTAGMPVAVAGTVAIETHGCKLNQADSAVLAQEFARAGYRLVDSRRDADIIVVNTCTVTATADSKARQALRAAHRANPEAVVVAAGCYPERAQEELRRIPEVSLIVGNRSKPDLVTMAVSASAKRRGIAARAQEGNDDPVPGGILRRSRAMVKIQEGCDQVCAYCIVPKVRGRERSIPPAEIVDTVQRHMAAGFKEITLTGTQLGTYGFDLQGVDLPALLDRILGETDLPRLRVSSLQAHEISSDLLARWEDPRICPHFHVPLQSGSDNVLKAMRRRYDTDTFRRAVDTIRERVPNAGVTTDVIAGFPGETERDHAVGLCLVREIKFADAHVFPYSQRPGTSAFHMRDHVPPPDKRRRAAELTAAAAVGFQEFRVRMQGQVRPVLWETAKPLDSGTMLWSGLTDNYVRVSAPGGRELGNTITAARLGELTGKTLRATVAES